MSEPIVISDNEDDIGTSSAADLEFDPLSRTPPTSPRNEEDENKEMDLIASFQDMNTVIHALGSVGTHIGVLDQYTSLIHTTIGVGSGEYDLYEHLQCQMGRVDEDLKPEEANAACAGLKLENLLKGRYPVAVQGSVDMEYSMVKDLNIRSITSDGIIQAAKPYSLNHITVNKPGQTNDITSLLEDSGFGDLVTGTTRIDATVRVAQEIPASRLDVSLVQKAAFFDLVTLGCRNLFGRAVTFEFVKLNVYTKGSHFVEHIDTPSGPHMVGTLVVVLPNIYKGGNFKLCAINKYLNVQPRKNILSWFAFCSEMKHVVEPVTDGTRITLTFNVLAKTVLSDQNTVSLPDIPIAKNWLSSEDDPLDESAESDASCQVSAESEGTEEPDDSDDSDDSDDEESIVEEVEDKGDEDTPVSVQAAHVIQGSTKRKAARFTRLGQHAKRSIHIRNTKRYYKVPNQGRFMMLYEPQMAIHPTVIQPLMRQLLARSPTQQIGLIATQKYTMLQEGKGIYLKNLDLEWYQMLLAMGFKVDITTVLIRGTQSKGQDGFDSLDEVRGDFDVYKFDRTTFKRMVQTIRNKGPYKRHGYHGYGVVEPPVMPCYVLNSLRSRKFLEDFDEGAESTGNSCRNDVTTDFYYSTVLVVSCKFKLVVCDN